MKRSRRDTCGTGRLTRYPARIVLSRPVQAGAGTQFTRLTLTYYDRTPDGRAVEIVTLPTL